MRINRPPAEDILPRPAGTRYARVAGGAVVRVSWGTGVSTLRPAAWYHARDLEDIIAGGLRTFVEVGRALLRVRDEEPYEQDGYVTFAAYLRGR